eukprot:PhF_6_TR40634/c0_g1_i1/m.60994
MPSWSRPLYFPHEICSPQAVRSAWRRGLLVIWTTREIKAVIAFLEALSKEISDTLSNALNSSSDLPCRVVPKCLAPLTLYILNDDSHCEDDSDLPQHTAQSLYNPSEQKQVIPVVFEWTFGDELLLIPVSEAYTCEVEWASRTGRKCWVWLPSVSLTVDVVRMTIVENGSRVFRTGPSSANLFCVLCDYVNAESESSEMMYEVLSIEPVDPSSPSKSLKPQQPVYITAGAHVQRFYTEAGFEGASLFDLSKDTNPGDDYVYGLLTTKEPDVLYQFHDSMSTVTFDKDNVSENMYLGRALRKYVIEHRGVNGGDAMYWAVSNENAVTLFQVRIRSYLRDTQI